MSPQKPEILKHSETLFHFPVRIYDSYAVQRAQQHALDKDLETVELEYVVGECSVPYGEIIGFHDHFKHGRRVENIAEKGFDSTKVMTRNLGDYVCSWRRERFMEEFDRYMQKMDQYHEDWAEWERAQNRSARFELEDDQDEEPTEEDLNL
jgi:hypothetical protein